MTIPPSQNLYGVAIGTGSNSRVVIANRDPGDNDTSYFLLQEWFNKTSNNYWVLNSFKSSQGVVTANWLKINSGAKSPIETITGNDSIAESPLAGNFNIVGTGSITTIGSANTETIELTGLTNHAVLVGAGTPTITSVSQTASSGYPLISQAGADPAFSTQFEIVEASTIAHMVASNVGGSVRLTCSNTDNTNTSSTTNIETTGASGGGDAYFSSVISPGFDWEWGISHLDNSWRLGHGGTPSTLAEQFLKITTTGAITFDNAYTFPTADGAANQILSTNGSGTISWVSPQTLTGWQKLTTVAVTAGVATIDMTPYTPTYQTFMLKGISLFPSVTGDVYLQVSLDGTTYETTQYLSGYNSFNYNSATLTNTNSTSQILLGNAHATGQGFGLNFFLWMIINEGGGPSIEGNNFFGSSTSCDTSVPSSTKFDINGLYYNASGIKAIKVTSSGGLTNFGFIELYGIL